MNDLRLLIHELCSTLAKVERVLNTVNEAIVWTKGNGRILRSNVPFDQLVNQPHILNLGSSVIDHFPLLESNPVSLCTKHPVKLAVEPNNKGLCIYGLQKIDKLLVLEVDWSSFLNRVREKQYEWSAVLVICDITERYTTEVALKETKLLLEQQVVELQRAEDRIRQQNEQLQLINIELIQANRLKDEFLANISHELRTPLNSILGMTEGLQGEVFGTLNEQQLKALQTVERCSTHLLGSIDNILDVAKIEAGQIELDCTSISISYLCESSLVFIKQQALQKRIQLEIKYQLNLPDLLVDERRIRQVLIKLLNNAVKFTPEGGRITVEVTQISPDPATTDSTAQDYLRIAVTDTGIGIAPENIKKLFQPFVQIDSALNRQYDGTGLGLALVKGIVELHGGRVGISSELGVGSCFTIDLPCSPLSCEISAGDRAVVTLELNSPTPNETLAQVPLILLADDNEANISTVSSYLGAKGYRILLAKDGQAAIDMAATHQPDLILMDIQMPVKDGLEAIREIRLDRKLVDIPIIAFTALAMTSDRDRCLEAGANYYLSKPVKLKQLVTTIQQILVVTKDNK